MTQDLRPGDYGVVRTGGFSAWVIRKATRSEFNHAFIVMPGNLILEATTGKGAVISPLSKYDKHDVKYNIGDPIWPADANEQLAKFKEALPSLLALKGVPYNFLDILSIGLLQFKVTKVWLLDSAKYDPIVKWFRRRVERPDHLICSQLVDYWYHLNGMQLFDDGRLPGDVTPQDLFSRFAGMTS